MEKSTYSVKAALKCIQLNVCTELKVVGHA